MFRERTFILLLSTFVVGGLVLGKARNQDGVPVRYRLAPEILSAENRSGVERRWRQPKLESAESFGTATVGTLIEAQAALDGLDGEILVLDRGDWAVKTFDPVGRLARRFSSAAKAEIRGLRPIDFAISTSGEIWIAARDEPRVVVLDASGVEQRSFALRSTAGRLVLNAGGGFTIQTLIAGSHLFESYDEDGKIRQSFGKLLEGNYQEPLLLGGTMAADDDGLIFAPSFLGLLAAYNRDGDLRFVVETVGGGGKSLPRVMARGRHNNLEPGTPFRSLSIQVVEDSIYVLSERESTSSKTRILDVYALADGAYRHSLRLPNGPRNFLISGDSLFTVHKDRIRRWLSRPSLRG